MASPRDTTTSTCTAIVAIVVLEAIAMLTGHNGTMLRLALVAIAGLGGFSLAQFLQVRRTPPPPPKADDFLNR